MTIRLATLEDAAALEALIAESVNGLQAADYTEAQCPFGQPVQGQQSVKKRGPLGKRYGVNSRD